MVAERKVPEAFSLSRWSKRKLESARAAEMPRATPIPAGVPPGPAQPATMVQPAAPVLPPVESLTKDSDFSAFLQPAVDETLKRAALKKLFSDPHFNIMDGLDIYIDDYSKPDPIPPELLERLLHRHSVLRLDDPKPAPQAAPVPPPPATTPAPAAIEVAELPKAPTDATPANEPSAMPAAPSSGADGSR